MAPTTPKKYIDLDKNIAESNSQFLKKMPRFVVNMLKRIVYQEPLNKVLNHLGHTEGLDFLNGMIPYLKLDVRVYGKENLPADGRCFFAANHPFGILDGLLITHTVATKYGRLRAIANDAFKLIPQLKPFIQEVNVYGTSSKDHIRALNEVYASDFPITHFPSGEVSRIYDGKIQDLPWQKSFIKKAIEHQRDIVPIFFVGKNTPLFYNVYKIRKRLKLKMNIELMLLPRELFKSYGKTIEVHIGQPISYKTFTADKSHEAWAQEVRAIALGLGKKD